MIDGLTCYCEPVSLNFEIRDPDCPLSDEQHHRQASQEKGKKNEVPATP